ncbi:MAG TPA: hypothetical protein VME21_18110 [Steroidobacteraceae bacterium]|nr:hypothetical protein [Steroidobacteraceae bacterium]
MKQFKGLLVLLVACALVPCGAQTPARSSSSSSSSSAKFETPDGYKRVVMNGTERFCRTESTTGSRVQNRRVCLTRQQLEDRQNNSQDFIQGVQRNGTDHVVATTPGR